MENEIWLPVIGYEGIYEVSNLGRIKSLKRIVEYKSKSQKVFFKLKPENILSLNDNGFGYLQVTLSHKGIKSTRKVHDIVSETFLNHKSQRIGIVIDHINNDKSDNSVGNLQIITHRHNSTKDKNQRDGMNCIYKRNYGFVVQVSFGRIRKYFGFFKELEKAKEKRDLVFSDLESYL